MLAPIIAEEVAKATDPLLARIAELEARRPEPGPPGEKGEPGERGEKGENGADGSNGRDGAGIVDGFVSRDGHLIATLSDGTTRDFGEIVGKDGRDGEPGKDGRDGFGFDDMDVAVLDDDRTIELSFRRGDEVKAFALKWPTMIYRGVWSEGQTYQPGDVVTWGGSAHVAEEETTAKPETKGGAWRLAVKRGRDGKDAKVG
jgi:integrin beta 3